ncbi:MAG: type II secretion system protein [Candidatus Nomurabacteria bacterium]|nr:type II secretion system protein [Candidatus Nomurabacteria bacterium]
MKLFFKKVNKTNKGFTLVEMLVAISIFTVSLLGIMSVLASGVANTTYAKQKMVATYLAQEGIEYVRNMRDTEVLYGSGNIIARWNRFKNNPNIASTIPAPSDASFTRTISMTKINSDEVQIFSKVEWTQGSGSYSITFSENLFNWIE